MKEEFEQFVDYFRHASSNIREISERNGSVHILTDMGSTFMDISYDGVYMAKIIHYIAPIQNKTADVYYKINSIQSKLGSLSSLGVNTIKYNNQEYLAIMFAHGGNGDPYTVADNLFGAYDREYSKIENDINDLLNYI